MPVIEITPDLAFNYFFSIPLYFTFILGGFVAVLSLFRH